MEAVIKEMPKHWLEERRNSDASRWDEMWKGVLHMSPSPNVPHQELEGDFLGLLKQRWAKPIGGRAIHNINLTTPEDEADWTLNYRVPDILLLSPDRLRFKKIEYVVGPPLVCIEFHSPGDESYKKLSFYFELGVPEVWIIHRDTKKPEVFLRGDSEYRLQTSDDGWVHSPATDVRMKDVNAELHVRIRDEKEIHVVPE